MALFYYTFLPGELESLTNEGHGKLVLKQEMISHSIVQKNQCANMYMKPHPDSLPPAFFRGLGDPDLTPTFYSARFEMPMTEKHFYKIVMKYHPQAELLNVSDTEESQESGGKKLLQVFGILSKGVFLLRCDESYVLYLHIFDSKRFHFPTFPSYQEK